MNTKMVDPKSSHKTFDEDDSDDDSVSSHISSKSMESTFESTAGDGNSDFREVQNLTRKENEAVEMWRELVTGMMIITACFLTMATFIYLSRAETQSFRESFDQYVITIDDAAGDMHTNVLSSFKSMADKVTSYAQNSASEWPLVTMPFFQQHGTDARVNANVDYFSFCPLVMESDQTKWESYALENQWWLVGNQTHAYTEEEEQAIVATMNQSIPEYIYRTQKGLPTTELGRGPYAPRWQMSPLPKDPIRVNFDVKSPESFDHLFDMMIAAGQPMISDVLTESYLDSAMLRFDSHSHEEDASPKSVMFHPILESFHSSSPIVGLFEAILDWGQFLQGLLPAGQSGLYYVLTPTCAGETTHQYTFELHKGEIHYLGEGNLHDIYYTHLMQEVNVTTPNHPDGCWYSLLVYPSSELRHEFSSNMPEIFTAVIAITFFVMAFFFFAYDKYVQKRNRKVVKQAVKTNAIVSSFFPKSIRDRLFDNDDDGAASRRSSISWTGTLRLKSYLSDGDDGASVAGEEDKPIADLFPNCTVLFADIVGFTAWSSMREPTQVLLLLETIYRAFDEIAKRRKVFKVETIGDCYVAVTGLPEPNKLHGVVMARFAKDIMYKVHEVTRGLEVTLGPDTGDLSIRIGMHSGPVTAGVLRAERLRFQLFGDTVNTASRIESTGRRGCIHLSKETAAELAQHGKSHWVREREDKVEAKGKGELTTFWLSMSEESSCGDRSTEMEMNPMNASESMSHDKSASFFALKKSKIDMSAKTRRLVDWNVDVLHRILRQIAAVREVTDKTPLKRQKTFDKYSHDDTSAEMVLEEVSEVITLPNFTSKVARVVAENAEVAVSREVLMQLYDFVTQLASMYHDNPFHNFEHASHVTMSVVKLLSRIVAPADSFLQDDKITNEKSLMKSIASQMHDHTYGITSDPLTQFAVVLAALIHDVDHLGVPNTQLVKEETETAKRYKGKSVAEQNSVDLAWDLLMQPDYQDLRKAICGTDADWARFRQLVVNSVMATDIVDKELKELRNARWDKAFKGEFVEEDVVTDRNRKATIVIEHLIQASDVSHTMQHWHIYRKWNERLFRELYRAFKEGRAAKDPSEFWYKGEIGFFDFYIIPLTKKLKECGVFGVSSDEYLNYAQQNLAEWKAKGEGVVAEMIEKVQAEYAELEASQKPMEPIDEFADEGSTDC